MRDSWKTIGGFAALGFAITACFYIYYSDSLASAPPRVLDLVLVAANVVLCPPVILFAWCIDCENGTAAGVETNLIFVGLLNAGLYMLIGKAIVGRKMRKLRGTQSRSFAASRVALPKVRVSLFTGLNRTRSHSRQPRASAPTRFKNGQYIRHAEKFANPRSHIQQLELAFRALG